MLIIGFSGRKQAGKNTCANYLVGKILADINLIFNPFSINNNGQLEVQDIQGNKKYAGVFDITRQSSAMKDFCHDHLDDYIQIHSFADILKQEVCSKVLNLPLNKLYGSDDDKNTLTNIKWKDIDKILTKNATKSVVRNNDDSLTIREVLQIIGTNIFRSLFPNVWPEALLRKIMSTHTDLAVITDVRFPNEVEAIQQAGGYVIRLTRTKYPDDNHESETALDRENFDWEKFDFIIDNEKMTIPEQLIELEKIMSFINNDTNN